MVMNKVGQYFVTACQYFPVNTGMNDFIKKIKSGLL